MDPLAVGAEVGGLIAGLAILVSFGLWITRNVRTFIDTQRSEREQIQTEIAALKSQVTSLQQAMNAAKQAMTQHAEAFNESVAVMRDTGNLNAQAITGLTGILQGLADDSTAHSQDIAELKQHVKDLSKGFWPRVGGTHPAE
ncbi:MAG TPA: hypothetical protein VFW76_06865 [Ktedonobacterales bacterium]|nr:hypothetical protein [Ktedonobacterales bacterium]